MKKLIMLGLMATLLVAEYTPKNDMEREFKATCLEIEGAVYDNEGDCNLNDAIFGDDMKDLHSFMEGYEPLGDK